MSSKKKEMLYIVSEVYEQPNEDGRDGIYIPCFICDDSDRAIRNALIAMNEKKKDFVVLYVENGVVDNDWIWWKK